MPDDTNQQGADSAQQQDASGFPAPAPTMPTDNGTNQPTMPGVEVDGAVSPSTGPEQPAMPGTAVQPTPDAGVPMPSAPGSEVPPAGAAPLPPQPGDDTNPQPQQ